MFLYEIVQCHNIFTNINGFSWNFEMHRNVFFALGLLAALFLGPKFWVVFTFFSLHLMSNIYVKAVNLP